MNESMDVYRQRFLDHPSDVEAFEDYERELVRAQDMDGLRALYSSAPEEIRSQVPNWWMRLLRHLDQACSREQDVDKKAALHLAIGQVYEESLDRADQAIAAYQQAFRVSSSMTDALDRARSIYARSGNWDMVLRLWELQQRGVKDSAQRAAIHVAMGRVCLDHISDGARATDYARRALADVPGHAGAQQILDDYADLIRDWKGEVALRITDANEASDEAARNALLHDTLEFVVNRVPKEHADGAPIIALLNDSAPAEPRTWVLARAWYDRVKDAGAAEEAHRRLVDLLEGEERIIALREAAQRARSLERVGHELAARRGLLLDVPQEPGNFERLEELAEGTGDRHLLFQILEDAIAKGAGDRTLLSQKAARIAANELDNADAAEKHWRTYLEEQPRDEEPLRFLVDRARNAERYDELHALIHRLVEHCDPDEAGALLAEAATVAEEKLRAPAKAISSWRQYVDVASDTKQGREALRRLLRQTENWQPLADLLDAELQRGDERVDSDAAIARELTYLWSQELGDKERAIRYANRWVSADVDSLEAGEQVRQLAALLGDTNRIRVDLETRIPRTEGEVQIALINEAARLELGEGRRESARVWIDRLIDVPDTDIALLRQRLAIALEEDDVDAVLRIQGRIVERSRGTATLVDESMILAEYAENVGRNEHALEAFETVLAEHGNTHARARAGALRMLRALERWESLADLLTIDTQIRPDANVFEELAVVSQNRLGDGERAAAARHRALEQDASHESAARGLIRWYSGSDNWQALEDVGFRSSRVQEAWDAMFSRWSERLSEATVGVELSDELESVHARLRRLALDELRSPEQALRAATARATVVRSVDAWILAADTAQLAGDWTEEHREVSEAATVSEDVDQKANLWTRAAILAEEFGLGVSGGWEERTNAWLAIPSSRELRIELAQSAERNGQIHTYASLLDEYLPAVDDVLKVEFYRELGRLCTAVLDDRSAAREYWEALLAIEPSDREALTQLLGLYDGQADAEVRRSALERLIAQSNGAERVAYEVERAKLLDEVLDAPEESLEAWMAIRAMGAGDPAHVAQRIEARMRELERWEDLDRFFSEQLGRAESEEDAANAMVSRGKLRLNELGQGEEGVRDLQNLLRSLGATTAADHAAALLDPLVEGEHTDVVDVLVDWNDARGNSALGDDVLERRVVAHGRMEGGRWRRLLERLRNVEGREEDTVRHWIGFQNAHIGSRDEAARLVEWSKERGAQAILVRQWSEALQHADSAPAWWEDLVELACESGQETDAALAALRSIRADRGLSVDVVDDRIEEVLSRTNRFEEQVAVILQRAKDAEGEIAATRYVQAATLAEETLNDPSRAADWYHLAIRTGAAQPELVFEAFRNYFAAKRWTEAAQLNRDALATHPDSEYVPRWKALLASAVALAGESDAVVFEALRSAAEHVPLLQEVSDGLEHLSFSENIDQDVARQAANLFLSIGVEDESLEIDLRERVVSLTEDPTARLQSLLELGAVLSGMPDQQERAWDVYAEALSLEPLRVETMDALETTAGNLNAWRPTSELFVKLAKSQAADDSVVLFERAIAIEAENLSDLKQAAENLELLIAHQAPTTERFEKLADWYAAIGLVDSQVGALDRWADWSLEHGDETTANNLRLQAVELVDSALSNSANSIQRWRAIADQDGGSRTRALEELSRIYRREGAWAELDGVLMERVELVSDSREREELLREVAQVREEERRLPKLAIDAWELIIQERPNALDAIDELERLYRREGDNEAIFRTLQNRLAQTSSNEDRLRVARAGILLEEHVASAIETLCELIVSKSEVSHDALESLADLADAQPERMALAQWILLAQVREDAGDLPGAARANLAVARLTQNDEIRKVRQWVAVEQRVASSWSLEAAAEDAIRLWGEEEGNPERLDLVRDVTRRAGAFERFSEQAEALVDTFNYEWLRRVLVRWYADESPNADLRRRHLHALYAANPSDSALYDELVRAALPEERIGVWRRRMEASTDDAERQQLRVWLGLALAEQEDENARLEAQSLLEQYRMGHSANEQVNQTLRRLYAQGDQWQQLSNLIEEELWLTDDSKSRVRLLVERARCREAGETMQSMIVEGWFDVLAEDPAEVEAIDALADMTASIDDPFLIARVHDRLEGAFEKVGRWRELYELLVTRSNEGLPGERFDMLARARDIAQTQMRDQALTYATLCRMVALKPSHSETVAEAYALAQSLNDPQPLRDALNVGLQNPRLDALQKAGLRRISALLRAMSGDERQEAIADLSGLFDAVPSWEIVADVGRLMEGDVESHVRWLESRADAVDSVDMRVRLLREAASRVLKDGDDALRAGAILESIYALTPSESSAIELDQLYGKAGAHQARVDFWRAQIADAGSVVSSAKSHASLYDALQQGQAPWEERIRQLSDWRDALDESATSQEAMRSWNTTLDQLIKAWCVAPERADREGDLLDALVRRVEAKGYGDQLFRARVGVAGSEERADKLWEDYIRRRAEVSLSDAWNTATEALRDAPTREVRAAVVENLANQLNNHEEATAFLRHLANQGFEERLGLALRAARIDVQRLNLLERATDTLRKVLDIDPANTTARGLLREVLTNATRPELRRRVVETLIQTAREPVERASLTMITVFGAHERNDFHEATTNLQRALGYDPGNLEARKFLLDNLDDSRYLKFASDHLLPILRDEQAKPELGRLLSRLAEVETNAAKKAAFNEEIALLQAGDATAVQAWLKALRLHPHSPTYLDSATKSVASVEDAELLRTTILEIVQPSMAADVQSALYAAVGRAELEILEDPVAGEAHLLEAMEKNPRNENALTGLEAYYLASENYAGLAKVLSVRFEGAEDQEVKRTVAERLITLLRGELNRPSDAAKVLEVLVGVDASEESLLETLRSAYREAGDVEGEIRTLGRLARLATDEDERVSLMSEALTLASESPELSAVSLKLAEALLLDDPNFALALVAREKALVALGDKTALQAQLAIAERLHDPEEVRPAVRRALTAIAPNKDDARIIAKMLSIVCERGMITDNGLVLATPWFAFLTSAELRPVVRRLVQMDDSLNRRVALVQALAQLRPSTDEAIGMEAAQAIRSSGASDVASIRTLAQWYESAAETDEAIVEYTRLLGGVSTVEERGELLLRLASLEERRENFGEVMRLQEEAIGIGFTSPNLLDALIRGYERNGQFDQVMSTLVQRANVAQGSDKVRFLRRAATVAREKLGNADLSFQNLEAAIAAGDQGPAQVDMLELLVLTGQLQGIEARAQELRRMELPREDHHRLELTMGMMELQRRNYVEAKSWLESARNLNVSHARTLLLLGRANIGLRMWNDALEALQAALVNQDQLQPEERAMTLVLLGRVQLQEGGVERARELCTRALRLRPNFPQAVELLAELDKGAR